LQSLIGTDLPAPAVPSRTVAVPSSRAVRLGVAGFLLSCLLLMGAGTIHWPLVNDPAQIDYLCFLMDHGQAPYKDLIEMNMPGIYLANWGVMHVLGGGALSWRLFDLSLMGLFAGACLWIAWPWDWLGGLLGASLFILIHGRDGPAYTGQRDLIMAVLLVCACAFLFHAFRARKTWPFFLFGLCASAASTVKPIPLPFAALLLAFAMLRLRRMGRPLRSPLLCGCAGLLLPIAVMAAYLVHEHAVAAFVNVFHHMLPYYAELGRRRPWALIRGLFIPSLLWLTPLAVAVAVTARSFWNWESQVLLGGIAFGAFCYFIQGKGQVYHRYPFFAFLLLWAGLQLVLALRQAGRARLMARAGVLVALLVAPQYAVRATHRYWDMNYIDALQSDLGQLGGSQLSGHVQCMAMQADCDTVLYRMRLLQATGLSYDYFVFGNAAQPVVQRARARFWRQLQQNPPNVFVVSKGLYPYDMNDYRKLTEWPAFARFLSSNYRLIADDEFPPKESGPSGFRVYVRNGLPTPDKQPLSISQKEPVPGPLSLLSWLSVALNRERTELAC
jgi:hypothetical protein